jgi:hypothetical protein
MGSASGLRWSGRVLAGQRAGVAETTTVSAAIQAGAPFSRSPRVQNPCPQSTSHTRRASGVLHHQRHEPPARPCCVGTADQGRPVDGQPATLPCHHPPTRCSCGELASTMPAVTRGSARALLVSCRTALRSIRPSDDQPPTKGWLDPAGQAALEPGGGAATMRRSRVLGTRYDPRRTPGSSRGGTAAASPAAMVQPEPGQLGRERVGATCWN